MEKIIKPEGRDLMNRLNDGEAICNDCGAVMHMQTGDSGELVCPACGWQVHTTDYIYEEEAEWDQSILQAYNGDVPPAGCRACGGDYPNCKTSCKLFDE